MKIKNKHKGNEINQILKTKLQDKRKLVHNLKVICQNRIITILMILMELFCYAMLKLIKKLLEKYTRLA
jgi:hypothetical protein